MNILDLNFEVLYYFNNIKLILQVTAGNRETSATWEQTNLEGKLKGTLGGAGIHSNVSKLNHWGFDSSTINNTAIEHAEVYNRSGT